MTDNFFGLTDTGKQRENNEDTFIAQKAVNNKLIIACVIDGVGGYSGGEIAAALARQSILDHFTPPTRDIISTLTESFSIANEKIIEEKKRNKDHQNMACVSTLAIVDIEQNQFYYAHVGDTRLYLLRDNSLIKISNDHSFVGFLEDSGRLTEETAMKHPKRNEINKALGFESLLGKGNDYIETGQSPFLPGDMLLLCSDGLTDMIDKAKITSILATTGSLEEKCKQLIDAANHNGGKDNITVVLVHNDKISRQHNAVMPVVSFKKKDDISHEPAKTGLTKAADVEISEQAKKTNSIIIILTALCLLFLGSAIWAYLHNNHAKQSQHATILPVKKNRNKQETRLQDTINNLKGNTLTLLATSFKQPILLSDAIKINKDTLYIKTNGQIILKKDTGYSGAAISLSANCRHLVLDTLTLQNFNIGIISYNNSLILQGVRFINCHLPVVNYYTLPNNNYIKGAINAKARQTDSLNKK